MYKKFWHVALRTWGWNLSEISDFRCVFAHNSVNTDTAVLTGLGKLESQPEQRNHHGVQSVISADQALCPTGITYNKANIRGRIKK